jgi:hypothetical protein
MLTTKLREHDAQLNDRTSESDAPSSRTSGLPHHGHGGGFESSSCSTDAALVRAVARQSAEVVGQLAPATGQKHIEPTVIKFWQGRCLYDSDANQFLQLVYIRT